ncbi:MAG: NAD(P)/FAD-dependent oxidoreductase [Acidobacteria bacterium]|nr:NAD(P)/FAD-dependent oxidoreductase [Acidobacteriota bacterium]
MTTKKVVIIGGGPAGLTAARELLKRRVPAVVLEADKQVGGIARTVNYKGFLFDIGGHRFFTKWDEVNQIWKETLGDKFLERPRLSRIYYNKKFFLYPLAAKNALFGLGLGESCRILCSYIKARLAPTTKEENFEEWVCNRFGRRLYEIFFKTYTEKVWGVPCTTIRAEWAAQRIRGLSLLTAIRNAILPGKNGNVKTLIDKFHYPERGPGQMWETMAVQLNDKGYRVFLERRVVRICHEQGRVTKVITKSPADSEEFQGTDFISSMPIRELISALDPPPPKEVRDAADKLRYRDFLIVSLIVNRKEVTPDNWIYVHEPGVKVGRIQNFKNWSAAMVPDPAKSCLGMEYFVFEEDELWASPDHQLIDMARREIVDLGLVRADEIEDGTVVRIQKAYPMYDEDWTARVDTIRRYLSQYLPNLQLVGRNGMHKYNNQDHSMITAVYAARNICGADYDLWAVNTEPDYHEESKQQEATIPHEPPYAEPTNVYAQR